jgi:hypothetical protein
MAKSAARKKEVPVEAGAELSFLVASIMADAKDQGLFDTKESRITARVSARLIAEAKARTGIESDSELVKFAIAQLAVEDPFKKAFRELEGTVDPDLDLEF